MSEGFLAFFAIAVLPGGLYLVVLRAPFNQ